MTLSRVPTYSDLSVPNIHLHRLAPVTTAGVFFWASGGFLLKTQSI